MISPDPKRVLVTGGYGFVGRNLLGYLKQNHPEVNAMYFSSKKYDLTDLAETRALFKFSKPDAVIHLAATCGGIFANMMNPATFWGENLRMGQNILDASVEFGVQKLVMMGSVCSYPKEPATMPFAEDQLCMGWPEITNRPYGIAKLALLEGCRAYNAQHNLQYTYLIPTNMYGPADNFELESSHVIPAMMRKFHEAVALKRSEVVLWGDGTPSRDFLYVHDCARAIYKALDTDTGTQPLNLGSGQETTMTGLVQMLRSVTGFEGDVVWNLDRPNGQPRRFIDYREAQRVMHWTPLTTTFEGIQKTYAWYRKNGAMTLPN
jgi:GDP-L-fucose synthase